MVLSKNFFNYASSLECQSQKKNKNWRKRKRKKKKNNEIEKPKDVVHFNSFQF